MKRGLELVTLPFQVAKNVQKFSFLSDTSPGYFHCFNSKEAFQLLQKL